MPGLDKKRQQEGGPEGRGDVHVDPPAPPSSSELAAPPSSSELAASPSSSELAASPSSSKQLGIVSFNYAGIQTNPFEYLDGSKKMQDCSTIMKGYVQEQWGYEDLKTSERYKALSNLDKLYKGPSRYSICYRPLQYGLEETPFRDAWVASATADPTPILDGENVVSKVNEDIIRFDWDCYSSVTKTFTEEEVKQLFSRCYVDPAKKMNATATFIKSITDANAAAIIVIQEFIQDDMPKLKALLPVHFRYYMRAEKVPTGEVVSLIISSNIDGVQDDTFPNFHNETIAVRFGSYVVVGTHYPTKSENFTKGSLTKLGHLAIHKELMAELSKPENAYFIIGVDANHTLLDPVGDPNIRHTSQKRRSFLQTQFGKAEQQVTAKIDYILHRGPLTLKESKCVYDVTSMSEDYANLPHANMPYDHAVRVHYYDLAGVNAEVYSSKAGAVVAPGVSLSGNNAGLGGVASGRGLDGADEMQDVTAASGTGQGGKNTLELGGAASMGQTDLGGGNRKSKRKRNRKTQRRRRKSNRKKNRR